MNALRGFPSSERGIRALANALPSEAVRTIYERAVGDYHVALCLHRVLEVRRASDPNPEATTTPDDLDALLALIAPHHVNPSRSRLTLAFDDGYLDAFHYVHTRAPRHAAIEWLLFVCPEKIATRAGMRWDLYERKQRRGDALPSIRDFLTTSLDVRGENQRDDLRGLADDPDFLMVQTPDLEGVAGNVLVGNHLNCHFRTCLLSDADARFEVEQSVAVLDGMIGRQRHLAFPFGSPNWQFSRRDVAYVRASGDFTIWSTEQRPYRTSERDSGAVLPRIVHDGTRSPKEMALYIAWRCLVYRARRQSPTRGW